MAQPRPGVAQQHRARTVQTPLQRTETRTLHAAAPACQLLQPARGAALAYALDDKAACASAAAAGPQASRCCRRRRCCQRVPPLALHRRLVSEAQIHERHARQRPALPDGEAEDLRAGRGRGVVLGTVQAEATVVQEGFLPRHDTQGLQRGRGRPACPPRTLQCVTCHSLQISAQQHPPAARAAASAPAAGVPLQLAGRAQRPPGTAPAACW